MDNITHTLMGAVTSQAIAGNRTRKLGILLAILAANMADLDIFIRTHHPLSMVIYHRQFSHSLLAVVVGGLLITTLFLVFFKSMRFQWRWLLLIGISAYATHVFLDVCTSFGTVIYWPWNNTRVAWNILPIVDPFVTIVLFVGLWASLKNKPRFYASISLIVTGGYLLFCAYQHHRALVFQKQVLEKKHIVPDRLEVLPTIGQVYVWQSVYRYHHTVVINMINTLWLNKPFLTPVGQFNLSKADDLPAYVKNNSLLLNDFEIFKWFSDGFVIQTENPLTVIDARFLRNVEPTLFLWGISFQATPPAVIWRRNIAVTSSVR